MQTSWVSKTISGLSGCVSPPKLQPTLFVCYILQAGFESFIRLAVPTPHQCEEQLVWKLEAGPAQTVKADGARWPLVAPFSQTSLWGFCSITDLSRVRSALLGTDRGQELENRSSSLASTAGCAIFDNLSAELQRL